MALALTSLLLRNIRIRGTVCVLSRINLSHPSRHSTLNSRPFNLLQPLCSLFSTPVLCFQQLAASFPKTPGWGVPITSAPSSTSAVTCATWRLYPLCPQAIAHTFRRHGGGVYS